MPRRPVILLVLLMTLTCACVALCLLLPLNTALVLLFAFTAISGLAAAPVLLNRPPRPAASADEPPSADIYTIDRPTPRTNPNPPTADNQTAHTSLRPDPEHKTPHDHSPQRTDL